MKKTHFLLRKAGFTLIELLVVISIIALLAGLVFAGAQGAIAAARKAQAKTEMGEITNALQQYYTEYGRYPSGSAASGTNADVTFGTTAKPNNLIISVLRYPVNGYPTGWSDTNNENPRQIKFLQPKLVSLAKGGLYQSNGNWYDPWGTQYLLFIDGDYGGDVDPSTQFSSPSFSATNKVQQPQGAASIGYYYVKAKITPQPDAWQTIIDLTNANARTGVLLSWQ